MNYALFYVANGDWAVIEVAENKATIRAHSESFPANEVQDDFNLYGWEDSNTEDITSARSQQAWHKGGLEDAIVKVRELAESYSRTQG
jgi:hypothetical protein